MLIIVCILVTSSPLGTATNSTLIPTLAMASRQYLVQRFSVIVDPSGSRTGKKCCLFTDSALYSSDLKGVEGNMIRYDSILDVQWSGADFITILLTTGKICTLDLGKANTSLVQLLKELVLS